MAADGAGAADASAAAADKKKNWDQDMESEADESRSKLENCKYYTSLILGTLCLVCVFAFLFLVPFVLDPAISTLMHEFVDVPVTCKANSVIVRHGKFNCSWSSCREGCTADMYICFQVRVVYSKQEWVEGTLARHISDWVDLTRYDKKEKKTMLDTPLLINIKGCGYPPDIDCRAFTTKYDNISESGETFPCYYSKVNPWIVLETYSYTDAVWDVVASIAIPNGLFLVSLIVLLYWYCPYCQAKLKRYEEHTDREEKDLW
jgi:hypothetical protein